MKKTMYILGCLLVCFIIQNIYAGSNNIKIKLDCPATINTNSTATCKVYATVTGDAENVTLQEVSPRGGQLIDVINVEVTKNKIATGTNIYIGSMKIKAGSEAGKDGVGIDLQAEFSNGEPSYDYSVRTTADITVNKVISSVNTLNSINIDGALIPGFNKNTTVYSVNTTKSSVYISATKTSNKSTVKGTGTKSLKCGNNTFAITVKAENGNTKKYTVKINRACSEDSNLANIIVTGGNLSPSFSPTTYDYKVELDEKIENISLKGVKSDSTQKIIGEVYNKKIDYGTTKMNLVVTSQTGKTSTYTIVFDKKDNRDDNNLLSSLSLSSGNITFNPNTFEYDIKVLNDITKLEVLAVPAKETSEVKVTGNKNLKEGNNIIKIDVKSEKGTKRTYIVNVNRLKKGETLGNNANIKNMSVRGYDLNFDYNKNTYKLVIENEDNLDIIIEMDDPTATYEIKGNENLKDGSIIEIITKSNDGSTKNYTIEITKPNQTIYYVIFGILIVLAISIPIIVYFKSVKEKKELSDINGYKIGKEEATNANARKIIQKTSNTVNQPQPESKQKIVSIPSINKETKENVVNNEPIKKQENIIGKEPIKKQENIIGKEPIKKPENIIGKEPTKKQENIIGKEPIKKPENIIGKEVTKNKKTLNEEDFDAGLQDYVPNESVNKCPACGRELLGTPKNCPYCKTKLK